MRAAIVCIVTALAMMAAAARAEAQEQRRVALVIGNGAYQSLGALDNPRLDAEKVAGLLAANGFDVVRCDGQRPGCFDLTRDGLEQALETLRTKASGAELALVFYAGHGMEGRDGNVLAPIDTEVLDCTERVLRRGVPLDELFKAVSGARRKVVILDACRNDPFAQCPPMRGARPASFAPLSAPESESFLLVLSTKPGQVALDGPAGAHSPYARALLQWLEKQPTVYFHDVLSHTAKEVIEATSRANFTQVPEMLARGELPAACLKGQDCVGDVRAAAMRQELEALKQEHARDQDLAAIARDYLAAAENERARRPLTAEERTQELQRLKEVSKGVSDFMLEAAKERGRPFSREEEGQTLAALMDAGRALLALNDTRAERALERLKANDETEAERLFDEVLAARKQAAATAQARAADENKEAAKAARHLAAIAKPKNVARAADAYKEAAELDPAEAQTWIDYGRAARAAGRNAEASAAFAQADAKARESNDLLARHQAAVGLGDVADAQLRRVEAEQHYRAALALAEPAAKADPGNPAWQRALSTAHDRVGHILFRQNNFPAAAESLRAALAIAEPLVRADPGNSELAQDLASMHYTFGGVQAERRDSAGALASFQAGRDIADRFSKIEPNNGNWLSTLVALHVSIGFLQLKQDDLAGALASSQTALGFGERMTKIDPSNVRWQRILAGPYMLTGLLLEKQGDNAGALASRQAVEAIAKRLAQIDPGNPDPQAALALTHHGIGRVLFQQRDLAGALAKYEEAAGIYQRLLEFDATNENWQADLASVENNIGDVLAARGDLTGALTSYRAAIARFGKTNPREAIRQGGLWSTHADVARILEKQGDMAGALASYRAMQSIAENQIDSGDVSFKRSLALTHGVIGGMLRNQGNLADAVASYRAALAIDEELAKSDPGSSEQLQQVASGHYLIGGILRARNDLDGALASYQAALASYGKLNPDAAATQGALRDTHVYIGSILHARGDLAGALVSYQSVLAINQRLVDADPSAGNNQRLSWAHIVIGDVLHDQGSLADALARHAAAQDIAEHHSKAETGSADWQRIVAASYSRVAGVRLANGDRAGALALWRKALAIVEASAVVVEQEETKTAGKPGAKTTDALTSVEWHALLARAPAKALAAWQRARALVPELNAAHAINRAHALLFRNRLREARALYLADKGKGKLFNGLPLERVIADDFRALRRAGLAHPMMREVEVALGVAPAAQVRQPATNAAARKAAK